MTDDADSLQLAWLADRFRAQAALGLHYYPDEADRVRFEQLRRRAAELAALVDGRDVNAIEACFARDKGIHTPKAAIGFHISAADGDRIWRTAYLAPDQQLPDLIATAADLLGTAAPLRLADVTDSRAFGLPDPHTHLAVYDAPSTRTVDEIQRLWPTPETPLQHAVRTHNLADLPGPDGDVNRSILVSPVAAAICRDIASLAADGAQHTADPYNVERFEHLQNLASAITAGPIEYERLAHFDLNPEAAATGAELAIRDDRGRILLIQRSDTGQWAMPGGACEVGESWAATAAREAREEIGLDLDPTMLRLVDVFDNRAITAEKTTIPIIAVFSADVEGDSMLNTSSREVDDTAWVDAEELKKLDLFPGHRAKVTAALDYNRTCGDGMPIAPVSR